jgi:hypothetical protein
VAPSLVGPMAAGFPAVVMSLSWDAHWVARSELLDRAREQAAGKHLRLALENCLAARNASPLMYHPHLALALSVESSTGFEPQRAHLDRVKFLAPRLPDVWYYSGLEYLAAKQDEKAWPEWHRCLSLTDRYLDPILYRAVRSMAVQDVIVKVLPDRPDLLLKAGARLFPRDDQKAGLTIFRRAALSSFDRQPPPLSAPQLKVKLQLQQEFEQVGPALQTCRQLLASEPGNTALRLQLAELCFAAEQFVEARTEVRSVLLAEPNNARALALRERLDTRAKPR